MTRKNKSRSEKLIVGLLLSSKKIEANIYSNSGENHALEKAF
jgi:hypothetical protein